MREKCSTSLQVGSITFSQLVKKVTSLSITGSTHLTQLLIKTPTSQNFGSNDFKFKIIFDLNITYATQEKIKRKRER